MFSGVAGVGADAAWYLTSLDIEDLNLRELNIVGSAIDLFECFDQIIRSLMYVILMLSGLLELMG